MRKLTITFRFMYIRNNYTLSDAFCQEGTERKAKAMVSRSLLAPELEQDDSKISVSPHYSSDQLTNLETISFSKQEDTQQTELTGMTTPQTPIPDAILHGKGLLINRNFAWLAIGQAISNLGDFVFSTTLFIWVFTLTHSAEP